MNVLHIFGSPRLKGNTADISHAFFQEALQHGASVTTYHLNKLNYRGCQGCYACKKNADRCILQDEITPALDAMQYADVIVFSSPVFYTDVTAQLKGFIDRTFGYLVPHYWKFEQKSRLKPGKQLVFLLVQGAAEEHRFDDVFSRYQEVFTWLGFEKIHLLRSVGVYWPGEAAKKPDIMAGARQLGRRIFAQQRVSNDIQSP